MRKGSSCLSIRFEKELHDKFQYVAQYEGRSMSAQILWLMNQCVRDFEKENGPIVLSAEEPKCDSWKY